MEKQKITSYNTLIMIIIVYGEDAFRTKEKVSELREAFKKKFDQTGLNLSEFPDKKTGKTDPEEVLRSAVSSPFLATRRMTIVRDLIGLGKKENSSWSENFKKIPLENILIIWETTEPVELEKKSLFKKIKELSEVHFFPFPKLEGQALSKWTTNRIVTLGGTASPIAIRALIERAGNDLWQLDNEINKLITYADDETISIEMINLLTRANFDGQIFALMDAVSNGRKAEVLQHLEEERASGATDGYIFSMLLRQIHILLGVRLLFDDNQKISKEEVASQLSLHPFVASKALQQIQHLPTEKLRKIHDLFYTLDLGTKSGRYSDRLSVDLAIVAML